MASTRPSTGKEGRPPAPPLHLPLPDTANCGSDVLSPAFLRLLNFLPDVYFFAKNAKGEFQAANQGFVEMLGAHRLEDILGKTDHDFSPRHLADAFVSDDRRVISSGQAIANRVELVPNADGSVSWHVTSKVPLLDGRGRVVGLAGVTRDLQKARTSLRRFSAMSDVIDHMERNFATRITVEELAALAHLSVSQFERRFRAVFGASPMRHLQRVRLDKACALLAGSDEKITAIASRCGFYDHSHFIRLFTRAIGMSPLAYRRQASGERSG